VSGATRSARPLRGLLRPPGDKSTTHRGLLLAGIAEGVSTLRGALDSADTRATAKLLQELGTHIVRQDDELVVTGCPLPRSPADVLECGNSGTTARLVTGLLAGRRGHWALDGDASLRRRPMDRVAAPLRSLGASIEGDTLPLTIDGAPLRGGQVRVDVPSAQVKSALLLAGLVGEGPLTVLQHTPTRDHTERMLPAFGIEVEVDPGAVTVVPGTLRAAAIDVPGDPSSAAFLVAAALLVPGSHVKLVDVGLWPRRTGFLRALDRAGADVEVVSRSGDANGVDPCGELSVRAGPLRAFDIAPEDVPDLVDEVPVLALVAALAEGTSRFAGLAELRVKESDRVAGIAELLAALGVQVDLGDDELVITGVRSLTGRADCDQPDHRLAMTAAIARLACAEPLPERVPAASVSWPGFLPALEGLLSSDG
jgi:3-phosphoshikimate 1-carboxyvinyltransferase